MDPNEAAFPWHNAHSIQPVPGLTKRELFAARAMQGFASNSACSSNGERNAAGAVQWADALLAALDQPTKEGGER